MRLRASIHLISKFTTNVSNLKYHVPTQKHTSNMVEEERPEINPRIYNQFILLKSPNYTLGSVFSC